MDIFGLVKEKIDDFSRESIEISPGYLFNQAETLKKIDFYYGSQFITGTHDREGFKKFFFNINKSRVNTAKKATDLDTKDIRVIAEEGQSFYPAWFFEKELRQFMKEEKFGVLLNEIVSKAPRYGSVVIKDVDGKPQIVLLRNLVNDQTVNSIKSSSHVIERHLYKISEFRELGQKKGWDNVEETVALYEKMGQAEILMAEFYGFVPEKELGKKPKSEKMVKTMFLLTGVEFYNPTPKNNEEVIKPFILFKQEIDEWPYRDWHWDKEEGRWLGVGVVEDLFGNQESVNELNNLLRKSLYWSSKKLFQTKDQTAPRNLFTEAENGSVFQVRDGINPVSMEERNLPQYNLEFQRLERNSDQRAFTFEVNTGESLPSGTPFRLGAILANAVNSYYAFQRENLGMFIKEIIEDFIIPGFIKKKNKAHVLSFEGESDELEKIAGMITNHLLQQSIQDFYTRFGRFPTVSEYLEEQAIVTQKVLNKGRIYLEIPEKFYKDLKYRIDIVITGEQIDLPSQIETLTNLLTLLGNNPGILQDPQTKIILEKILNKAGENPIGIINALQKNMFQAGGLPQLPQLASQTQPSSFNVPTGGGAI